VWWILSLRIPWHSGNFWPLENRSTLSSWKRTLLLGVSYKWSERYCYCLQGGIAQGVSCTATNTDLLCFCVWILIISNSSTRAPWKIPAATPSSEVEKLGEKYSWNLSGIISLILYGFLTSRKILRHGTIVLTFPLKKVLLWIFIARINPLSLAGFKPAIVQWQLP
jgi:hypothetical protein